MMVGQFATLLPFDLRAQTQVRSWINQEDVRRGTGTEGPVSDFEHQHWYERMMTDPTQRTFLIGMGCGTDAAPVGVIGLRGLLWRYRSAEFWIYLGDPQAEGKGIAREASTLLLRFAFQNLGLHRVFLQVDSSNARAIHLYEALGFQREGVLRQAAFVEGKFVDRFAYGILADDFRFTAEHAGV